MKYLVNGNHYSVKYSELKGHYDTFCKMEDEEFMKELTNALHLAVMICWFKDTPSEYSLGDEGIVHELVHLLTNTNVRTLVEIREDFEIILKLD